MSACAISNQNDYRFREQRETEYLKRISEYSKSEVDGMTEMFAITAMAVCDNSKQDFLGVLYGQLGLNNSNNGQFFTPYHIGEMMAKMNLPDSIEEKPLTVSDPCCGAGCLLIACVNEAKQKGFDLDDVLLFAQDVDQTAALMCYIQLSLLDAAAVIKIGDSLSDPLTLEENGNNLWLTPRFCGLGRKKNA